MRSTQARVVAGASAAATLCALLTTGGVGSANAVTAPQHPVTVVASLTDGGYGDLAWHDGRIYANHNVEEIVSFNPDGSSPAAVPIPEAWRVSTSSYYDHTIFDVAPDGSFYLQAPVDQRDAFGVGHLSADGSTVTPTLPPPNNGDTTPFHGGEEGMALSPDGSSVFVASHYREYLIGSISEIQLPLPADQHDGQLFVAAQYDPNGPDVGWTPFSPGNGFDSRTQIGINRGPTGIATSGNYVYYREWPSWVQRVDRTTHQIVTIAGKDNRQGTEIVPPVEGGKASEASLLIAAGPAVDRAGNVFIATTNDANRADGASTMVWEVRASDGTLHRVAGTAPDETGDKYPETGDDPLSLELHVVDLELDPEGNLYLSSYQGYGRPNQILRVDGVGTPDLTAKNGKIAFGDTQSSDLFASDADGQHRTNLTNTPSEGSDPNLEYQPSWSPDGTRVAFVFSGKQNGSGGGIVTMDADGGRRSLILPTGDSGIPNNPQWSPDGTELAYDSINGLFLVHADGTRPRQLLDWQGEVGYPAWPAFAPDGTRLAFSALRDGVRQVFTVTRDGTDLTQITHSARDSIDPAWSPDGAQLLYSSNRGPDAGCTTCNDLYVSDVDGSNETKLLDTGKDDIDASWSPDGTRIAFTKHVESGAYTVMTAAADGTDLRAVGPGEDPTWQPLVGGHPTTQVPVKSAPVIGPVLHKGKVVGLKVTTPATSSVSGASTSAYEWFREDGATRTPLATTPTYTFRATDAGRRITLDVTLSAPGYGDSTATSNAYNVAGRFGAEPTVSHEKGRRLTSTAPVVVGPGYSLSYQWRYQYSSRKVKTIAGATGLTLTTTSAQKGKDIWLVATATKPGFPTITTTSNKVTGR